MFLGQISLNISFFLYIFLYLPQVLHNHKQTTLVGLSLSMHLLLYLSYSLDLLYGCNQNMPWQYCAVSTTGWLLLNLQHFQFIAYFHKQKLRTVDTLSSEAQHPASCRQELEIFNNTMTYSIDKKQYGSRRQGARRSNLNCQQPLKQQTALMYGIVIVMSITLAWGIRYKPFNAQVLNGLDYLAQLGFVIAFIPQIFRSKKLQSAYAINVIYLSLNFCLAGLDTISAWQLGWGWPNKFGAGCMVLLTSVLLLQHRKYKN